MHWRRRPRWAWSDPPAAAPPGMVDGTDDAVEGVWLGRGDRRVEAEEGEEGERIVGEEEPRPLPAGPWVL